jgi:hypothetical protein
MTGEPGGYQELMRCRDTGVILATGGRGLVRAALFRQARLRGRARNVPAYIERTADVPKAVAHVIAGKTFDDGIFAPRAVHGLRRPIKEEVIAEIRNGGYFLNDAETAAVAACVVTKERLANPEIVGKPARSSQRLASGPSRDAGAGGSPGGGATSRSRSRSSPPCSPSTWSRTGTRAASGACSSCATVGPGTRWASTVETMP